MRDLPQDGSPEVASAEPELAVAEIDAIDPVVLHDPVGTYRRARERAPLARLAVPGFSTPLWVVTRHAPARAMLADPRLQLNADSFLRPPGIPEECQRYLHTMAELNGQEHLRLRRLVAPAFTPHRVDEFRPRIESTVAELLDDLPTHAQTGNADPVDAVDLVDVVDLVPHFARKLPIEVICDLVGIAEEDRPRWRTTGAAIAAGNGPELIRSIPGILADAQAAIARRKAEPAPDLLADLVGVSTQDGDRLSDAGHAGLASGARRPDPDQSHHQRGPRPADPRRPTGGAASRPRSAARRGRGTHSLVRTATADHPALCHRKP
ncbi:MAG TPA: hypothetical protein VHX38_05485 [Pseudonocardiaceae bacterium]|jgi:cytochrome P450|nr:hypothetical protein [Pseudonocardiaceae bacterium]